MMTDGWVGSGCSGRNTVSVGEATVITRSCCPSLPRSSTTNSPYAGCVAGWSGHNGTTAAPAGMSCEPGAVAGAAANAHAENAPMNTVMIKNVWPLIVMVPSLLKEIDVRLSEAALD